MKNYNELLHIYYENINTKDLKMCINIIQKILKDRGHIVKTERVKFPKVKKIKGNKFIGGYFLLDYKNIEEPPKSWFEYIMVNDEWNKIYEEMDKTPKYYVYIHSDISMPCIWCNTNFGRYSFNGTPFYIGKGVGDRINDLSCRSKFHVEKYKKIKLLNEKQINQSIYKVAENLTEKQALILESKLITFFGCVNQISNKEIHFTGRKGGLLINRDSTKVPNWVFEVSKKIDLV